MTYGGEFPIGQRVTLPGHFPEAVLLEGVRPMGNGYECRVRLPDGTPDEAILSADEVAFLFRQTSKEVAQVTPADPDKLLLLISRRALRSCELFYSDGARECSRRT
jgi:hypothetical protein